MLHSADMHGQASKQLEIAFYILDRRGKRQHPDFWAARQRNVERYLRTIAAPPNRYSIVLRQSDHKPKLWEDGRWQNTDVAINLVNGGCG